MPSKTRILVVDDEASMRDMVSILLGRHGFDTTVAGSGNEAIRIMGDQGAFDIVVTDLLMDNGGGIEVLTRVKELDPHCEVILVTAYGTTESAVEAMKKGAYDYIAKPFNVDEFLIIVRQALERRNLIKENLDLKARVRGQYQFANVVGKSSAMRQVMDLCQKVADSSATVLVSGESGVGKEIISRAIHHASPRKSAPFIAVNCGALPEQLMESELFGHVKGAFTGAVDDKEGLFKAAENGTIFLDEIGELAPRLQVKMLRVLQERTIRPVGSNDEIPVNVRIIAATNQNLEAKIDEGLFRTDLYYRLNVIHLKIPPLRERKEDISPLIEKLLEKVARRENHKAKALSGKTLRLLLDYDYPGNVRELSNILERATTLSQTDIIEPSELPPEVSMPKASPRRFRFELPDEGIDLERYLEDLEKDILKQALSRTNGVQNQAAPLLGLTARSLRYRLTKLGL